MYFSNKWARLKFSIPTICLSLIFLLPNYRTLAQLSEIPEETTISSAKLKDSHKNTERLKSFIYQLGFEYRPARVIPSEPFYNTDNDARFPLGFAHSEHLKFGFSLPERSLGGKVFRRTYQGIGAALFDFGNRKELGRPFAVYLFQKSGITGISPHFSIDYEWNFGLSTGWVPYDPESNPKNTIVGSKVNAYINLAASLRWQIDRNLAMMAGMDFTHFSNGNTEYPNSGVNLPGIRLGVAYDIPQSDIRLPDEDFLPPPKFTRFLSYDMVVFGSWRRKGVNFFESQVASPYKYPVVGAYFAPMYNWGYRFRSGISLDALYDGSANVYTEDYIVGTEQQFFKPKWNRQVGLGLSARVDYVMPLFTIGVGIGTFALHKGGDLKGTYQSIALKIRTFESSFVHIGYNIKDFHEPNYLMLGLGYRFNDRTPSLLSQ